MLNDKFLRGSVLLFFSMMMGNVFGYLFQLAMGRMLPVAAYGEMNALMSFLAIAGIPFVALMNFFSRVTAAFFVENNLAAVKRLHFTGLSRISLTLIPVMLIPCLFSSFIGNYLGVKTDKVLIVLACIYVTGPVMINTGVIQGMQLFRSLSLISCGLPAFKFAYAVLFVWFGWGVYGAIGGLLATAVTLLAVSQWLIGRALPAEGGAVVFSFQEIIRYAGGLFVANACFSVMTQADVMLVKHYFSAHQAGLYSSAAVMGKAVMYLPGAIVLALFPMAAANQTAGRSSAAMLTKALILTLLLSGSGALILYLFPEFVMGVLFGVRYAEAAEITALFGIAMLPMAFLLLLMNYLLAQGKIRFIFFIGLALVTELVGIHFLSNRLENILYVIMVAGVVALVPMSVIILRQPAIRREA